VAVYSPLGVKEYEVEVNQQSQEFAFDVASQPYLVKFDADNYLLAEIEIIQTDSYWLHTLGNSKQAIDRYRAAEHLLETKNKNLLSTVAGIAMDDKFWTVQLLGLNSASKWDENGKKKLKSTVEGLLKSEKTDVRAAAIKVWQSVYQEKDAKLYRKNLDYISYQVNGAALKGLAFSKPEEGVKMAQDSLFAADGIWRDVSMEAIAAYGSAQDLEKTNALVASQDAESRLMWLYFLSKYVTRAGQEGKYIVDLYSATAVDESAGSLAYYAYEFLLEGTEDAKEQAEKAEEIRAKQLKELVKYAESKIKAIDESK
jgi:hypothetical protein